MATVLVVDDDALSREFLRTLLSYRGHQVEQASDGDSALAMAARRPPDAVITDVLMPGLDGYELARALRGEPATRHVPIAFSTAHYGLQEIRTLARAYDVHDVILKPAQPSTVLATIDSLLGSGQLSLLPAEQVTETQQLTRSGTWELDLATNTILVSRGLRDVLGLSSLKLATHELMHRVHPDDVAGIATMVEQTWCTGMPATAEVRMADAEGAVRELIMTCRTAPVDGSSQVSRLWGVAQDVTQIREELRTRLQQQVDWHAVRRTIDAFHRAVLPPTLPAIAGVGLAAVYLPAPERLDIGAAWYDARAVAGGRLLLSVGKVAGHDRHPAAVMGHALSALQTYAHDDPDPVGVLSRLNRFLTDTSQDDTYVTAIVALFDPVTGHLRIANGGHPAPMVVSRDGDGEPAAVLVTAAGPAMGVLPGAVFRQSDLYLSAGSAFCAYTDGLIDRHDDPPSVDTRHLRRVAARVFGRLGQDEPDRPPAAQFLAENLIRDMLGGAAPDDDVCLAVLHVEGEDV
jgi:serine phosphatase RsbU (regulator of sigma subunit)/DNA-binding response OmpR family regulator